VSQKIVINSSPTETRVAIVEDERLAELFVERGQRDRTLGSIYVGRVVKLAPSMQAAFVDLGLDSDGFLPFADARANLLEEASENGEEERKRGAPTGRRAARQAEPSLKVGQVLPVQVVKEPIGTKGARLTMQLSLPGRYMVLLTNDRAAGVSRRISSMRERRRLKQLAREMRPEGMGVIIRTVAENHSREQLEYDLEELGSVWGDIEHRLRQARPGQEVHRDLGMVSGIMRDLFTLDIDRVVCDDRRLLKEIRAYIREVQPVLLEKLELYREREPVFDRLGIEEEIEKSLEHRVWLKGGGYLVIEHTEAMISVDVNSGRYTRKRNLEDNALKVNLEAARELCRQLRLRDIGGLVVIDFIDMVQEENRLKLQSEMKQELKKDRAQSDITTISRFGLMEMTRERVRPALIHTLHEPCQRCGGTGLVPSRDTLVTELERWVRRFRAASSERRLSIHVSPDLHEFLCSGWRSILREMMWRNRLHIKLVEDGDLDETEFRCWSVKRDCEVTAQYARGVGANRMIEASEEETQPAPGPAAPKPSGPGPVPGRPVAQDAADERPRPARRRRRRRRPQRTGPAKEQGDGGDSGGRGEASPGG